MNDAEPPSPNSSLSGVQPELIPQKATPRDAQIEELQEALTDEKDARVEERFVFIILVILLLNVVFFTVMPTFGGPLALTLLELLVLVPLARRMGMQEIAQIISRVIGRVSDGLHGGDRG